MNLIFSSANIKLLYPSFSELKQIKQREYQRVWYIVNKEKKDKQNRVWYQNHKDQVNEYRKKWAKEHKELQREYERKWRKSHPETWNAKRKRHDLKHKEDIVQARKKYRELHKQELNERSRAYYLSHKNEMIKSVMEWQGKHPELVTIYRKKSRTKPETIQRLNKYQKEWRKNNPEKVKETSKRYRIRHPDYTKYTRDYERRHPEKTKSLRAKTRHARRRNLGWIELNKRFKDSHGHHINTSYIIHVPNFVHKIPHNHKIPESMIEINKIAFFHLMNEMMS